VGGRGAGRIAGVLFGLRRQRRGDELAVADGVPSPADAEAVLIERARSGDLDAFNRLVEKHQRAVHAVCLRYLRSAEAAEDVAQDTFIRAWRALDTFRNDEGGGFRTWLLTIAANRARDILRSQARRPADSLDDRLDDEEQSWEPVAGDESPLDFSVRGEVSAALERALGQIGPDQRLAIILGDIQGHSYDEIAEMTGVAIGTVKSRINRGRARLREMLLADQAGRELFARSSRPESGDGVG
jgi:RNA polymerase sigma-70 factor (ECF subfamily)